MNKIGNGVMLNVGVYVGRFNPIHMGHQRTIDKMLFNHTLQHSLLFIGSANATLSLRNLFSYRERKEFIQTIYPELKIIPLADQDSDEDWFESLIDMVEVAFPFFYQIHLYCGDLVDIANFPHDDKITIQIVDRYKEQVYSATEVRESIMNDNMKALRNLVDHRIVFNVYSRGRARLHELVRGQR